MEMNDSEELSYDQQEYEQKVKEIEELESIVGTVTYSLPVALIKMCQLNNYAPLGIEKYYELISPTFHLLKRTDGSKYTSNTIKTVRAAMLSDQLFFRNEEGLYVLNITNAINHVRVMQKRKLIDEEILKRKAKKLEKREKKKQLKIQRMLNKKRKNLEIEYYKRDKKAGKIQKPISFGKYGNAYNLFCNLLKILEDNQNVYSNLNIDLDSFATLHMDEDNQNNSKIIGMLTAFKFFRPFLEKNFASFKVQEKIIEKLADLNNEIRYMTNLIRSDD